MDPYTNISLNGTQDKISLGGFWRRVKAAINVYLENSTIGKIAAIFGIDLQLRIDNSYWDNISLTADEETYLDNWYTYFENFYKALLAESELIINFNSLEKIDDFLQKCYSVKAYYLGLRNTSILSDKVFEARSVFVAEEMDKLIDAILHEGSSKGLLSNAYNYKGLIISGVTAGNYNAMGKAFSKSSNISSLDSEDFSNTGNPSDVSIDTQFDFSQGTPGSSSSPSDSPTEPNSATTPEKKKGNLLLGVGLGIGVAALIKKILD